MNEGQRTRIRMFALSNVKEESISRYRGEIRIVDLLDDDRSRGEWMQPAGLLSDSAGLSSTRLAREIRGALRNSGKSKLIAVLDAITRSNLQPQFEMRGNLTRLSVDVFLSYGPVRSIVFEAEIHPTNLRCAT